MKNRLNRTPPETDSTPPADSTDPVHDPSRHFPDASFSAANRAGDAAPNAPVEDARTQAARNAALENDLRPRTTEQSPAGDAAWGEWEAVTEGHTSSRFNTSRQSGNGTRASVQPAQTIDGYPLDDAGLDDEYIPELKPDARATLQMRLGERMRRQTHPQTAFDWNSLLRPENLLTNLMRLGFMLIVVAVLGGTWVVASAHLEEQMLGAPQTTSGLIDPTAGQGALTPDNIEHQILAFNLRLREEELTIPAGTDPRPRPFTINPGEAARFVAARLQSAGFVHDADLFNLYLRVNGLERRIEAGNFMLSETMTMPEVAEALQTALFEEVLVTIPEGFRAEEIAERLAENNVIEPDRFLAAVRQPQSLTIFNDYPFLQDLPADASLEGFLFPDTYRFPVFAAQPELVLAPFLNNFNARAANELAGGTSGFTGRELITLASIVEREAVQADERPLIASVYVNRLAGRCVNDVGGTYLQADPTVQYARGTVGDWWWQPDDISQYSTVISPYNTYLHQGLPPGPIASPGLSAIQAASNPASSEYCFFLGTGDEGRHVFARTLAEHEQNMMTFGY
jgi:UPF0755 protein